MVRPIGENVMTDQMKYTSKELLNQLLDTIDDKIYFKDLNSRFILINKSLAKWHGFDNPEDAIGTSDKDRYTEEDAQRMLADEQHIIETGEASCGMEEKETWATGEQKWVSTTKMPLRDQEGNIIGTFGISRDITEHKLNEIELHRYARKLTQINKQMEDDLRMAANLQQAFLPQLYPAFPAPSNEKTVQFFHRYIASTQVSGDLCSIRKLNETEAAMLVCDVMGHGVRSALITAIIHTMISDLSARDLTPGEFFTEMNRQLRPILQSQDAFIFVTASYLILNTKTGMLSGASAGHPIPFIVRDRPTHHANLLQAIAHINGPALAVMGDIEYKTCAIQLDPGDTVMMYTDGILEELNPHNEEFGTERALGTLNEQSDNLPETLCNSLLKVVRDFNNHTPFSDDVCLLAFRWNGPST
jgi:sigma-B regulation protein RsbU (phosphoserine phosphatase)